MVVIASSYVLARSRDVPNGPVTNVQKHAIYCRPTPQNNYARDMDISRRTWIAAVRLAAVISAVAALAAVAISTIGHVSDSVIVAAVVVVAFAASWVQTGRVRSGTPPAPVAVPLHLNVPAR